MDDLMMTTNGIKMFIDEPPVTGARIKVVGVGGGGSNAVNRMIDAGVKGVDFIVANTDLQALNNSKAPMKIQLGTKSTRGLGAGSNPEVGKQAALEDHQKLLDVLEGSDMVFVTAGLGGGTGTGAAPVVASLAIELGALTVAVVTKPFTVEGKKRMAQAEEGIAELRGCVDTLITIPNQKLLAVLGGQTTLLDAFKRANEVLQGAVQGIAELITRPGLINVDFADVKGVMSDAGSALMGIGSARGEERARKAAESAINSPLLEASMEGARGVLISIAGGSDLGLFEIHNAATQVQEAAHEDANIIFGTVIDDNLGDEVRVTVIAAGFDGGSPKKRTDVPAAAGRSAVGQGQAGAVASPPKNDPLFGDMPKGAGDPFEQEPEPPRRNTVRLDDDDVDVPSFMKR